ncbi:MAG: AGE family epimerase/isomerase, partial [Alphaproteobacteria bacterium]|nr:AGE family epimerase/isomerase [Alphaproteobacteria bacterium]
MVSAVPVPPDFRSTAFLRDHIAWMIRTYHPTCVDPRGGYFHYYWNDMTRKDPDKRALVSSARMIVSYAMAARTARTSDYDEAIRHGLRFLHAAHRNPATGGYAWMLGWKDGGWVATDATNHCYGLVHVVL